MRRATYTAVLTVALAGAAGAQGPGGVNNPNLPGPGMQNPFGAANPSAYNPYNYGGFGAAYPNAFGQAVNPYSAAGSIYNRATQPLSPYLNLLRGGNPAVNYFYGVRPGLAVGQPIGQNFGGAGMTGMSQLRSGYLPAGASQTQEPTELPKEGAEIPSLPPSSHPVSFAGGRAFGSTTPARGGVFGSKPPPPKR